MFIEEKVRNYVDTVDSTSPTPGGGSVIALVGALASSLARMYAHLTLDKKSYAQLDETTRAGFEDSFFELSLIKEEMMKAVDQDAKAYTEVIQAYRLPKVTIDEIDFRTNKIQLATLSAIEVPQKTAEYAYKGMCLLDKLIPFGNKNAISDVVIAVHLLSCVVDCSIINMEINISVLTDETKVSEYSKEIEELVKKTSEKKEQLLELSKQFL